MTAERNIILSNVPRATQSSYRAAVAGIINGIKAEFGHTDQDIADRIQCSAATVNNASNQRGNLDALTLARIGETYGLERLGPYAALFAAKLEPVVVPQSDETDIAVVTARAQLFLARALTDSRIDDDEILEGASDIEAAAQAFGSLKWRLDGLRSRREQRG